MKLLYYHNPKMDRDRLFIGKTGHLRFKKLPIEKIGIEKGQRWLVGIDSDENKVNYLYILRNQKDEKENLSGFKVSCGNNSFHMNIKGPVEKYKIEKGRAYDYELFEFEDYKGFRILIK